MVRKKKKVNAKKAVEFSNVVVVHELDADKDRTSLWMQHAVDRFRFRHRIERLTIILVPMLQEKKSIAIK